MYRIAYNGEMIFDLYADHEIVTDAHLSGKTNAADYLDFTVMLDNPIYSKFKERQGTVEAWQDSELIFRGTIETIELDTQGNKTISCVSEFDNLNNVHIRPYSFNAGEAELQCPTELDEYFAWLIQQHNKYAVGSSQDFELGVNQAGSFNNNSAYGFKNDSKPTTASEITDKIIDRWGGYLMLHYEGDRPYIDFYSDVHDMNTQVIDFGVNITSFTKKTETKDQYTAIYPVGGTPQPTDTNKNPKPITIKTISSSMSSLGYDDDVVHDPGSDYIYLASAVAKYGYHEQTYSDDTALTDIDLIKSAVTELKKDQDPTVTITVKAVDLSLYMDNYEKLRVGQAVRIRSNLHNEDEYLMVESIDLDLNNPENSEYTLGASYDTLTGQQSGYLKKLNASINSAVDTVSSLDEETKAQSIRLGATEVVANDAKDTAGKAVTAASTAQDTADGAVQENAKQATRISTLEANGIAQVDQNTTFQAAIDAAKERMDDQQGNLNDAIDRMEQNRQEAANATQGVRDDLAKTEDSMNSYIESNDKAVSDAVKSIATVSTAADNAQKAADKVAGDLKATDVKVTQNTTDLGGLSTQMTAVKETADASLGLSTQHTQDIKGINDTLTTKYITKDETLIKVAEVQKTADAISSKLSSDYTTTANADAKYSTKSELNQSAAGIRSDVEKTYATKDSVTSQVSAVQQSADAIALNLSTNYQNSSDIAKTYATQAALKATSDSITSEVSQTYATKATTDALQNIADNAVETFMGSAVPTTSNAPAKDWNTDALRKRHSGDIYYSTTDGKSYRYGNPDSQGWQWTLIQDSDITKAIQDAANAQTTANTANSGVQKLNTDIPLTYATKTNVSETADAIKLEASKTYATQKSLTDAQADIKITTDGISADVSKNYQKTSTADEKYATKASLKLTDDKIATSISAQASKDASTYSTKNELSQTASGLDGRITETAQTAAGNLTTTKNEFQAKVDSINTTLSQTNSIAKMAATGDDNLVINGSFETGTFDGWHLEQGNAPSVVTEEHDTGKYALKTNGNIMFRQVGNNAIVIIPNHTYRFSARFKSAAAFGVYYRYYYTNASDIGVVGSGPTDGVNLSDASVADWKTVSFDHKFTAGEKLLMARWGIYDSTASVFVDSISIVDVTDLLDQQATNQSIANRVTTAEQNLNGFKTEVSNTYTKQTDFNTLSGRASQTFGFSGSLGKAQWGKIGTVTMKAGSQSAVIEIRTGSGWNGGSGQNSRVQIMIKRGNNSTNYTKTYGVSVYRENCQSLTVKAMAQSNDVCEIWAYFPWGFWTGNYTISGLYDSWDNSSTSQDAEPTSGASQDIAYRLNPEQLQSDVAATYATQSSVQQTATQITSQVTASLNRNGGNMLINGGFETGDATGWRINATCQVVDDMASAHSGRYYLNAGSATEIIQPISVPLIPGHTYRFSGWYRRPSTNSSIIGGIRFQKASDGTTYDDWLLTDFGKSEHDDWTYFSIDGMTPSDGSAKYAGYRLAFANTSGVVQHFDDLSFEDISDYSELSSRVTQTAQQWGVQLNQVATENSNAIADVNDALDNQSDALTATSDKIDDEISQRQAYMNFTQDETGNPLLELGASQNSNKVDITNEKVSFKSEGSEVAYISNKELHINNATIVQKLIIGNNIGFIPRPDGHLTLTRI